MELQTIDLAPRIGSEVRADIDTLLSGKHGQEIHDLLVQRGVLVFRDLPLDDAQLKAFASTIGTRTPEMDEEGIFKVTLDPKVNPQALILYGTRAWHMDRLDTDIPPLGTLLSPRVLADVGGETEFANTYAAFEDLPAEEQQRLEGLMVTHRLSAQFRGLDYPAELADMLITRFGFERDQPLVWRHRSGRKSLVMAKTGCTVVGMDQAEGEALLDRLMAHATQPHYVYRHHWRMGDLVIWDNTGTMHRVLPFDPDCGRELHRVTLAGEEQLLAVDGR